MMSYIQFLVGKMDISERVICVLVVVLLVMNIIGELLEFKGKVVPEWVKIRKFFNRRKQERLEAAQTLQEVRQLLSDVNGHYSDDNITKRNDWMNWVNARADVYDNSIVEISTNLADVTEALKDNTKLTEEIFVQNSRDRIIDFASKVVNEDVMVSREEFNRIIKVHEKYEKFLDDRGLTNGEVDIAYRIIIDSYENHLRHHTFVEDVRGYNTIEGK